MYERQKDIQTCMTQGKTRAETTRELAKKWSVSVRTMEVQYDNMITELEKEVEAGRAELRAKLMARNDEIYKKSMTEGKYKTALDANIAQAKIGGLMNEAAMEADKVPQVITITERETGPRLVKTGSDDE